ncbi:MAG: PAS domain S-box protein [Gammaproteobacteria bacterium]|nr:MAG: PAS domain S-box protein [Gammaproteobacteria bacterium]
MDATGQHSEHPQEHSESADVTSASLPVAIMRYIGHVAVLAVLYFLVCRFFLQLQIWGSTTASIWAPAGIALALFLINGWRLWPGIFLGAFFIDPMTATDGQSLLASGCYAAGVVIQAFVGALLVAPYVNRETFSVRAGDEWRFLLTAGPIACLVSPSITATVRNLLDQLHGHELFNQWLLWWAGDTLGVILFTPLLLHLWAKRTCPGLRARGFLLPLVVTILLLISGNVGLAKLESSQTWDDLEKQFGLRVKLSALQLGDKISQLAGVERFFAASERVTAEEFQRFSRKILDNQQLIRVDWAPRVSAAQRQDFEDSIGGAVAPGYRIVEIDGDHRKVTAAQRADYYPVQFSAYLDTLPFDPIGLDHGSFPMRHRELQKAILTGKNTVHTLRLYPFEQQVLMVFIPSFTDEAPLQGRGNFSERLAALRGFVVGIIDLHGLFLPENQGNGWQHLRYRVTSFDGSNSPEIILSTLPADVSPNWTHVFDLADHRFQFDIAADVATAAPYQRWIFLALSLFAASFVSYAVLAGRGYQLSSHLQQQELQTGKEFFNAIVESIHEQIAAFDTRLKLMAFNQAYGDIIQNTLGRPPQLGESAQNLFPANALADADIADNLQQALLGSRLKTQHRINVDGEQRTYEVSFNPVYNTDETLIGATYIARDITSQNELETMLKQQLDELTRWQKATLGRESRAMELKREVNRLLERLGEQPRYHNTGDK